MHSFRLAVVLVLAAALALPSVAGAGTPTRETPIVVRVDEHGFRSTDAVIGAIAGIGTTLVVSGCVALVRLQRSSSLLEKGKRP
jgi:hypothetical protein